MAKISKGRRQDILFEYLKNKDEDSAISISELCSRLRSEDIYVNERTVRRDVDELSLVHAMLSTEDRPERYYISQSLDFKHKLELNENTLQVLMIALNNLKHTSHEYFNEFATEAETAILSNIDQSLSDELRHAKTKYFFGFNSSGKPEDTNLYDFEMIMVAIREKRIFTCFNESPYKDKAYNERLRQFSPILFNLASGTAYLVVKDEEDKKIKTLRVSRLRNVNLTEKKATELNRNEELNLKSHVGGFGITKKPISIKITCDEIMAGYFKEKKIHQSQTLHELRNGNYILNFKCADSSEIIRFISSFGGHVLNITPKIVYDEVKAIWESGIRNIS
ncbi:YafY family protein [Halobacteriovorax sp. HLS]|uniref:helix-turn-helix transcriptional regulator n=1 Tax=Halobacteriovorax sp. HLS TaxID=2234000 RepID=UPI000FD94EB9|nr:WYL domain-containing protein [Halobacteriovorax sp. HLS]